MRNGRWTIVITKDRGLKPLLGEIKVRIRGIIPYYPPWNDYYQLTFD